jgi:hypothetical protein
MISIIVSFCECIYFKNVSDGTTHEASTGSGETRSRDCPDSGESPVVSGRVATEVVESCPFPEIARPRASKRR